MLIVRFSAMGDVIMSLFAVSALRKAYPDLKITVATKPKFAGFYAGIPDVEVLVLDKEGSLKSLFRLMLTAVSREALTDFPHLCKLWIQEKIKTIKLVKKAKFCQRIQINLHTATMFSLS